MATILIEDLPAEEGLSASELDQVFGAGPRRRTRITYRPPAEVLELRQMLSATPAAGLVNNDVTAYDVATTGQLSFNAKTGGYLADLALPGGKELDTAALKIALGGSTPAGVDPLKGAAALGGLTTSRTSNYDQVAQGLYKQFGDGDVYVSTRSYTDWASPENLQAVAGGGATASGQAVQEAKDVIVNELGTLYQWLKRKDPVTAESTMAAVVKGIMTGQSVKTGTISLTFVGVNETTTVSGAAVASTKGPGLELTSNTVSAVHKGFSILYTGYPGGIRPIMANSLPGNQVPDFSNKLPALTAAGERAEFAGLLGKLAGRSELKGLGKVADAVLKSNPAASIDSFVSSKLAAVLNALPATLNQLYKPDNAIVDLRGTQIDENLAALLGKLAAGNGGSVTVTRLQYNTKTFEFSAQIVVRHRQTASSAVQSWGSVGEILKSVGKQAGQWQDKAGNLVTQRVDAAGSTVREIAYKSGDKIGELVNKSGASTFYVVKAAGTLAKVAGLLASDLKADLTKTAAAIWNLGGQTRTTVAEALAKGIGGKHADLGNALLKGIAGTTLANVAGALNTGAGLSLTNTAAALWSMGGNTRTSIVEALAKGIGGKYADMGNAVLKGIAGTTLANVAGALKTGAGLTLTSTAAALWAMGGNTRPAITEAMVKGIGGKYADMGNALLKGISGTQLPHVAYSLGHGAGINMTSVASALWAMGGNTRTSIVDALARGIGGKYADMGNALRGGIPGTTLAQIATALHAGAKINGMSVAQALLTMGGNSSGAILQALKDAGIPLQPTPLPLQPQTKPFLPQTLPFLPGTNPIAENYWAGLPQFRLTSWSSGTTRTPGFEL